MDYIVISRNYKRGDVVIKVDNTKRYNQLAIELLKRIFNGYYKLGARLPSAQFRYVAALKIHFVLLIRLWLIKEQQPKVLPASEL